METCQFAYCLLSRTRQLSDLPDMSDWKACMDTSNTVVFKTIDTADFLLSHEFGQELLRGTLCEMQEIWNQFREFMDRLVDVFL